MSTELFSDDYNIYWPAEYENVVNYLTASDSVSGAKVFTTNMEVIVFAASVGLREDLKPQFDYKELKEISIRTFLRQRKKDSLAEVIYLICLCDSIQQDENTDIDLMRNAEGEKRAIHLFQRFAAGGLSYLNEEYISRPKKDRYRFVYEIASEYLASESKFLNAKAVESSKDKKSEASLRNTPLDFNIG